LEDAKADFLKGIAQPVETMVETAMVSLLGPISDRMAKLEAGQAELVADVRFIKNALSKLTRTSSTPDLGSTVSGNRTRAAVSNLEISQASGDLDVTNITTGGFFRKPDPTMLFVNTHGQQQVSRASFEKAIGSLLVEAGLTDDGCTIIGDALDNRFELKWDGDVRTGAARALQFFQSLSLGRGKWKKQVVVNDQKQEIQFYVGPDKNGAQIRKEVLAKRLKEVVQDLLKEKQVFVRKATGTLFVDKRPLVSISITGEDGYALVWYAAKRIALDLDEAVVADAFASEIGGPSP